MRRVLDVAQRYAAWAAHTREGRAAHRGGVLFRAPRKLDMVHLVPVESVAQHGIDALQRPAAEGLRRRDGFKLTDAGTDLAGGLDQAHYCIWCHEQGKDSCAHGLLEKRPRAGDAATTARRSRADPYKKSVFGVTLAGCPLEERISEFHKLRAEGWAVGALATICVDNPMVAATGHRICNDCMKACIYQKQDPVDIPQSETRVLKDVLALPFGFEIYSLLTRWNPLDLRRPKPLPATGKRVLVVGQGPAGFTLAHHLLNDGHTVVAIDGLKIEPLDAALSGVTALGERVPFAPVEDFASLTEPLDDRVMAGFGGVAEYGITVRWDKNFLKVIRLLLERRARYALYGGVRFGGTIDADDAFAMGFDHIALAAGAGRPTVLDLPHGLAHGVRTASDFLMALQLTGAAKNDSIANMQVRLPVVVIGGGLTAIDTATEALAYYPVQVEKFLARYETLVRNGGDAPVESAWSEDERRIADEFLSHARAIRAERAAAAAGRREPAIAELLRQWGGATIAYRKRLIDSPSYTLNHEEVEKALEEGIRFAEGLTPLAIDVDDAGHASGLAVSVRERDDEGQWIEKTRAILPARTILVAAGTQPNTVLAREDRAHFALDGRYFELRREDGSIASPLPGLAKPAQPAVLTHIRADGRAISFFGDLHPSYHGNVVKAMASARQGYPDRVAHARARRCGRARCGRRFLRHVERNVPGARGARRPSDADDRRSRRSRAGGSAPVSPRPVLSAAEFRIARRAHRWHAARDGRTGAHRRLGRSRARTRLGDRARDGRLVGPLCRACAGRAGRADGTDRRAHRNRARQDGGAGRRRTRQRGAVLDRPRVSRSRVEGALLRRLPAHGRSLQGRGHRGRGRRRRLVLRRGARIRADAGRRIARSSATSSRRCAPMRRDSSATQAIAFAQCDRIIAIGSDRMMAAVAAARHDVLAPYLSPQHRAHRLDQFADAMHDEGDLRAMPAAAARSGDRQARATYSPASTRTSRSTTSISRRSMRGLQQNAVQEKLTARWVAQISAPADAD